MRLKAPPAVLAMLVLLGLSGARPCAGVEAGMRLDPRALRPGDTLSITPGVRLDARRKIFVRLLGPSQVDDLPADASQVSRGLLRVRVPKPIRQGRYDVQLVGELGEVLDPGARLRMLATDTPTIAKIAPDPSYAVDGAYAFELLGENFGNEADESTVKINDEPIHFEKYVTDRARRLSSAACQGRYPCLVGSRRRLQIYGLSLDKQPFHRPMAVSVQVDSLSSAEQPLLLSWAQRRTPTLIAFAAIAVIGALVFWLAREKAQEYRPANRRYSTLAYLFIEAQTNTYSLSRFQLVVWTGAAIMAYAYLAASQSLVQWKWQLADVPQGLPTLLGLSVGTTALSIGTTEMRGSKGAGPAHPSLSDFVTSGGVLAPDRLQFFLWTLIGVFGFVSATLAQDPATVTTLPKVPENFLPLMGVSAAGYLAGKVVRKPGPVVRQLEPRPPYDAPARDLRIVGENLSPRAQVTINGVPISRGDVTVPPTPAAPGEFVTELVVSATAAAGALAAAGATPPTVRVTNPDGQTAEL